MGVLVEGASATSNRVLGNFVGTDKNGTAPVGNYHGVLVTGASGNFANDEQGIDLGADGPTANDPGDIDNGPNGLQYKPVLSSAKKDATGTTTVRGTLESTPDKTPTVQFFSNPEGTDEGKTLLGSATVGTDGSGDASFAFSTKKTIRLGQNITATATGAEGTSEFSAPKNVVAR